MNLKKSLLLLMLLGVLFRCWGIERPWGTKDHYNYGGVYTSAAARCLKKTPFSESRGVPHVLCETPNPAYYPNHPPTVLYGINVLTGLFGDYEWSNRLFTLIFSVLNIFLVFQIARRVWPVGLAPYWAGAFQALTLGGIYFGTHLDFISEFTISFCLLSGWAALVGRPVLAGFLAWIAGLTAWPGYMMLGVLVGYFGWLWAYERWFTGPKGIERGSGASDTKEVSNLVSLVSSVLWSFLGAVTMLATLSYLSKAPNVFEFLMARLNPVYQAEQATQSGVLLRLSFLKNIVVSLSRLLSPWLATVVFFEMGRRLVLRWRSGRQNASLNGLEQNRQGDHGDGRENSRAVNRGKTIAVGIKPTLFLRAFILTSGTWAVLALVGYRGMMVHVFEYLFLIPALALVFARFCVEESWNHWRGSVNALIPAALILTALVFTAIYPFGIYQSSRVHDVINSAAFVLLSLGFVFRKSLWQTRTVLVWLGLSGVANFSQTVNYRLEPDAGRAFCGVARREFTETGAPVRTTERRTMAKDLYYCAGIPVVYEEEGGVSAEK